MEIVSFRTLLRNAVVNLELRNRFAAENASALQSLTFLGDPEPDPLQGCVTLCRGLLPAGPWLPPPYSLHGARTGLRNLPKFSPGHPHGVPVVTI